MKYSAKGPPPPSFVAWLDEANENWTPTWQALQNPQIGEVRGGLLTEQSYVCAYCGRGLKMDQTDSHIDHFRPRMHYNATTGNDLTLDFSNFVASCGPPKVRQHPSTCGDAKGNWFDENTYIAPWDPGCEPRFVYGPTGVVTPAVEDAAAQRMIEVLALDHDSLVDERATVLAMIEADIAAGEITAVTAQAEVARWAAVKAGRRIPFSHVAVQYLKTEFSLG